jgi:hypothetical protein
MVLPASVVRMEVTERGQLASERKHVARLESSRIDRRVQLAPAFLFSDEPETTAETANAADTAVPPTEVAIPPAAPADPNAPVVPVADIATTLAPALSEATTVVPTPDAAAVTAAPVDAATTAVPSVTGDPAAVAITTGVPAAGAADSEAAESAEGEDDDNVFATILIFFAFCTVGFVGTLYIVAHYAPRAGLVPAQLQSGTSESNAKGKDAAGGSAGSDPSVTSTQSRTRKSQRKNRGSSDDEDDNPEKAKTEKVNMKSLYSQR